jgi:hypothetical protein
MALLCGPTSSPDGLVAQLRSLLGPDTHTPRRSPVAADPSRRGRRSRAPPSLPTSSPPPVGPR